MSLLYQATKVKRCPLKQHIETIYLALEELMFLNACITRLFINVGLHFF
jgi:hypothetical protein